jgi:hypothetical protein
MNVQWINVTDEKLKLNLKRERRWRNVEGKPQNARRQIMFRQGECAK